MREMKGRNVARGAREKSCGEVSGEARGELGHFHFFRFVRIFVRRVIE